MSYPTTLYKEKRVPQVIARFGVRRHKREVPRFVLAICFAPNCIPFPTGAKIEADVTSDSVRMTQNPAGKIMVRHTDASHWRPIIEMRYPKNLRRPMIVPAKSACNWRMEGESAVIELPDALFDGDMPLSIESQLPPEPTKIDLAAPMPMWVHYRDVKTAFRRIPA